MTRNFLDHLGDHIEFKEKVPFSGNVVFASRNNFKQVELSRRDDLISLCYLLNFFMTGKVRWNTLEKCKDQDKLFRHIKINKLKMAPKDLC